MELTVDHKSNCLLAGLILLLSPALVTPCFVETASGRVQGGYVLSASKVPVRQFLGIPFAQPPVGSLRFKKPQPVQRRNETIVALTMPPACIQYVQYPFPWYDDQDGKSEDCLYMNIWSPRTSESKLPVLFWIYGRGFTVGSNRMDLYRGQELASVNEKVIVVTFNYRLSALGFLTSGTEDAPGNVGMYDMLEALKWVNQNIEAFGGDPDKVTLVGQSAGSIAIGLLCVSPLTQGLFKRVIMESGSPAYLLAEDNTVNIATSQKLAKAVGCANEGNTITNNPQEVVSCLREKDAMELVMTINSFHPTSARSFFPSYGDELLPTNAREALIAGNFHDVNVFIGNNFNEGIFQLTTGHPEVFGFFGEKDAPVNQSYAEFLLRSTFKNFVDRQAVVQHYLGCDFGEEQPDYDYVRRYKLAMAASDYSLFCPTVYFAESYAKKNNRVYYYMFEERPSSSPWAKWMGVVHFDEVQFVFGEPLRNRGNYSIKEYNLSQDMIMYWTYFAKNG